MSNAKETKVEDHDYSLQPVPQFARRRLLTMFMIMLGFTFFSASMWTGQTLGDSLDLSGFIGSLILGGIILAIYTGSLAYVGAKTGLSLDPASLFRCPCRLSPSCSPSAQNRYTIFSCTPLNHSVLHSIRSSFVRT